MTRRTKNARVDYIGGSIGMRLSTGVRDELLRKTETLNRQARHMHQANERAGRHIMENVRRQYAVEGKPDPWAPLAPSTVREKTRLGYGNRRILQRTGDLQRGWYYTATDARLIVSNRVRVGRYNLAELHEGGTRFMPARSQLQLTPRIRREIRHIYQEHLGL